MTFLAILLIALYLLTMIIACCRNHRNAGPIIIVNLFLGWTLLGWVLALAWSMSSQPRYA